MEVKLKEAIKVEKRIKAYIYRIWKQKKMWYEKMIRAVTYGIDNLKKLEKLEEKER